MKTQQELQDKKYNTIRITMHVQGLKFQEQASVQKKLKIN